MSSPGVIERPEIQEGNPSLHGGWIVTVYNNDYNTYEEVVMILMIATGCSEREAFDEAWEIDHLGKSVVHHGAEKKCRDAAEIIEKIGIRVEVREE